MPLGGTGDQIRWVEVEPMFIFYGTNAYRDPTDRRRQRLVRRSEAVTPTNIVGDAEALLAVAAASNAARHGKVGAVGFCMSGGLVISLARAMPERIAASRPTRSIFTPTRCTAMHRRVQLAITEPRRSSIGNVCIRCFGAGSRFNDPEGNRRRRRVRRGG